MEASEFLRTPQGLRHKSLVQSVTRGSRVRRENGSWTMVSQAGALLAEVRPGAPPIGPTPVPADGWLSYSDWNNSTGQPISSFTTTWKVPPAPLTLSTQTIFLFNSIQDAGGTHILQPVLQWGSSAVPGSSNSWGAASWWVGQPSDPCFITDLVRVNVGDVLTGRIQLIGQNAGLFNYLCEFVGLPATKLTAENLPELTDCTETLETYGVRQSSEYPAAPGTAFTAISLQIGAAAAPLSWTARGASLPRIVSNSASDGEVDVIYPAA